MKTDWDYTDLAKAYLKRPAYAEEAVDEVVSTAGLRPGAAVCDVGAGTGKLTLPLLRRGLSVTAVEPNDAMRALGIQVTSDFDVRWIEATAEAPGLPAGAFQLVTFGSSFPTTDRPTALRQIHRLLRPGGWLALMSNHRDLDDPIQKAIEAVIHAAIPDYRYGLRREDQTEPIRASGLFGEVHRVDKPVLHHQSVEDIVEAWRSHGTVHRQAGDRFHDIIAGIEQVLVDVGQDPIAVPYTTRLWLAQAKG
jgi:ubiquinone/menaquinone biosynthesis C-methylase UbiE